MNGKDKGVVFGFESCVAQDVFQLRCLAHERGNTAALNTVVRSFVGGVFAHVIKTCHDAFESGVDLDEETINMMRHVFEARLALMTSIPYCPDDTADMATNGSKFLCMVNDLHYADENLSEFSSAVLMLSDDEHDDAVDGEWWKVDGNEWFCTRRRLDETIPRGLVEFLLSDPKGSTRLEVDDEET
jgi:hypothetical protein